MTDQSNPKTGRYVPTVLMQGEGIKIDRAGNETVKVINLDVNDEYFIFEGVVPPQIGVPLHYHKLDHEIFYVLEGQFQVQCGEQMYTLLPGAFANFTKGTPHSIFNSGTTPGKALFMTVPGTMQGFFEELDKLTDQKEILALADRYGTVFMPPPGAAAPPTAPSDRAAAPPTAPSDTAAAPPTAPSDTAAAPDRGPGITVQLKPGQAIVNSIGMNLVAVPAGTFTMGAPDSDRDAKDNEKPQHKVRITKPFLMGQHLVTYAQFKRFMAETGYVTEGERNGKGSFGLDLTTGKVEPKPEYTWKFWLKEDASHRSDFQLRDDHPIVCVSWNDAQEFCQWLSRKEGAEYRLPTEAEWEYAARAGTTTRFFFGDNEDDLKDYANVADAALKAKWTMNISGTVVHLPPYAKPWNDGFPFIAPVGSFKPNPWGLYDLLGNVGEWCSDWFDPGYYRNAPEADPQGPPQGPPIDVSDVLPGVGPLPLRAIRGGVWLDPAPGCRVSDRSTHLRHPVDTAADIGFRVVRNV